MQETWVRKIPWRREWLPTPVFSPGKSHGQRSLVGCNPWGRKELDMTELLHFHFSLSFIGEGNGNPRQCSCLENPRDGGATRLLVGCRLWGRTESDTTERLHVHFSLSCMGGGNGNPLQCSCLENPRDCVMRNTWLEEAQAGIKTAGRNINNLRYKDPRVPHTARRGA